MRVVGGGGGQEAIKVRYSEEVSIYGLVGRSRPRDDTTTLPLHTQRYVEGGAPVMVMLEWRGGGMRGVAGPAFDGRQYEA